MNAKKIMGAVLVALLAAALFVGAGAAADANTVFVYENLTATGQTLSEGTWTYGTSTVIVGADKIVKPTGDKFVPGTYKKGEKSVYIALPTATFTGVAGSSLDAYSFIGSNLYQDATQITFDAVSLVANAEVKELYVTYPNATKAKISIENFKQYLEGSEDLGTYSVQAIFNETDFAVGTPANLLLGAAVTFTVVEAGDATISVAKTDYLKGEAITVVITGQPGVVYTVEGEKAGLFTASQNQLYFGAETAKGFNFTMPNTGKVEFVLTSTSAVESEEEIILTWDDEEESVVVNFAKGTISAKTAAASYFVGDKIKIVGTTTAGHITVMNLTGTNFKDTEINQLPASSDYEGTVTETFEFELNTAQISDDTDAGKKLDVGTYTLTLKTATASTTVSVVLKQPFVSIIEAPEVIVQGDDAEFIINAEATTTGIAYYIFGTNFFHNNTANTHVKGEDKKDIENQFKITLDGTTVTDKMDAGQYFMVIQHPMYDKAFNIRSVGTEFFLNTSGTAVGVDETLLFDVNARQTANAAQALCDALDSQNIDDMYVKYSFFVVGENQGYSISEIPTEVVKGDKIVISGVDTANDGAVVQVEMISTAFAAVPKETVGSAAFIVVTTEVADDGTWEITLDTSDLNVDEYSLSVAIAGAEKKSVTVNVVEGSEPVTPTDEPTVVPTDEPVTPTEAPATPGFGALAALAGLGAVAVLLLRRE